MRLKVGRELSSWTSMSDWVAPFVCPPKALCQADVKFPDGMLVNYFTQSSWKYVEVPHCNVQND